MRKIPLPALSALCLAVVFCTCLAVSTFYYSESWSPVATFLSDFGNISRSPGALLFNMGCIMSAVSAIAFYIGMGEWEAGPILGLGRMLGIASGIALMMIGIFSEDFPPQHRFWSYAFFTINFFAILFTNISLIGSKGYGRPTVLVGFGISVVTLLSFILWGGVPAVEWFTVFASITFALLVGYDTYQKDTQ
jgi:hypothetical membrane protein